MADPLLDLLTPEERARLMQKSDLAGWLGLARSWGLVFAAFLLAGLWPNPLTVLLAIILLGGGQVGLAILMHDAAHRSMFASRRLNDWIGRHLCADPVFTSLEGYRKYHMEHHLKAGTPDDPDEYLTVRYPVSRASLRRKLLRDVTGITALRQYYAAILMYADYYRYQLNGRMDRSENHEAPLGYHLKMLVRNMRGIAVANVTLFLVLWLAGAPWLFLLWVAALFTSFQLFLRIRQIGDHGMVPDRLDPDPVRHTRTTDAAWWERLLISPHNEHLHLEHHLAPAAPSQNLPILRRALERHDAIPAGARARTYMEVLRLAVQ